MYSSKVLQQQQYNVLADYFLPKTETVEETCLALTRERFGQDGRETGCGLIHFD